ncbi:hypothetical protein STCU_00654 [Strigomonas culicis]|uniref:Protein-serine/threonine kinase n=1 Tax=Strigomonas culicis TaxID=28005 RepID=S9WB13_9TRYP|nr:hypothetical protein STCU_06489 [Strigomonas culicis]EPY36301.1 hypothetical protein STCU_00654 [Strigomonas culicis]|eukprot:EPY25760.1 hypothetical protein STCU_06489 [Strigomonas culicis]
MPLHTYSSLIKEIDKSVCPSTIDKYLSLKRAPMVLRQMAGAYPGHRQAVAHLTQELAVRTAHCLHCFSDPIVAKRMRWSSSARLRWVRQLSQREFAYSVALQAVAAKYLDQAQAEPPLTQVCGRDDVGWRSDRVQHTDDHAYVFDQSSDAFLKSHAKALTNGRGAAHAVAPIRTHEEARRALLAETVDLQDIPFHIALEYLRPNESLLDILVNEAAVRSDELNAWISVFCRNRVAWRVLHEHLMHVVRPSAAPVIVCDHTDVVGLLQQAADEVVNIYSNLRTSADGSSVTVHIDEDDDILRTTPPGMLFSSCDEEPKTVTAASPPVSAPVYSVVGHLSYIFRELLKNACVASSKTAFDVTVNIKYAEDDQWIVIDFIDQAGGIPAENGKNIWKFGWTTSDHYESHLGGFGVGLPTSKVYADMWQGSINAYTQNGSTTVRVRFPKEPVEQLTA